MTSFLRRSLAVLGVLCAVLVVAVARDGMAQTTGPVAPQAQPASPPKGLFPPTARPAANAPSGFYGWVSGVQQDYNRRLARAVRDVRTQNPFLALATLLGLSFAYGVLHAAGPGHGKAVISSYVLASEQTVRRGVMLSFLAALFQAFSALILVAILVYGLKATGLTVKSTEAWLETASWAIVTLLGAWLVWRQIKEMRAVRAAKPTQGHGAGHHEHHHHHDGHAHAHDHGHTHHHAHDHHHHHDHDHGAGGHACCDHAHMPDPKQLEGAWSWRRALMLAAAVGIRPCTGAILVLVFAIGQGLAWAGVFATFAMALGTAITVSALAAIAISSRELAARFGGEGSGWATGVRRVAGIGGSLAVMILGGLLFIGSLGPVQAF